MQEREEYPAGVPCYVDTGRHDPQAAMAFYGELLGWDFEDVSSEGPPSYFTATLHGRVVAGVGGQPETDGAPVWNTYVCVDDAEATVAKVAEAGGQVKIAPFALGAAGRMATFDDPEGAELRIWEPGQTPGAQLVNDPGAWVFSTLNTADADAAETFYGDVFGWRIGPAGDDGTAMVMKPGYQDFLAQKDPELPARLEQHQAPEGFGDVVAMIAPLSTGAAPRWDVTFAVANADATAELALELGGEIVTAPFDAPWVRVTGLRDPEGAPFTASQFVPPGS